MSTSQPHPPPPPSAEVDNAEASEAQKKAGNVYYKEQRYREALVCYRKAVDLCPSNHLIWSNCSVTWAALGDWSESEKAASHAVTLVPGFIKGHYLVARAMMEQGKLNEALREARLATSLDPYDRSGSLKEIRKLETALLAQQKKTQDPDSSVNFTDSDTTAAAGTTDSENNNSVESDTADETGNETFSVGKPSMKDFQVLEELGHGNFSTINLVKHRKSERLYALKIMDKMEVNRMKHRHPNIYNEIYTEKKALARLYSHPGIVKLISTFQTYSSLLFLLEFCPGGELWSALMKGKNMVGAHPSLARFWMSELILAVEHMHSRGLVHRDIKPENVLLTEYGHIKIIDFGTCKDLIDTSINGPEFVGTAQYMSPQAVASKVQGVEADLWALGCCLHQFLAGYTPYHAPSPYLCFLKTKKGLLRFPSVIGPLAGDLIRQLLRRKPSERLGSAHTGGYAALKNHAYFQAHPRPHVDVSPNADGGITIKGGGVVINDIHISENHENNHVNHTKDHESSDGFSEGTEWSALFQRDAVKVPKLCELCIRATADHLYGWSESTVLIRSPVPTHVDVNLLSKSQRNAIKHYLLRTRRLWEHTVHRMFHSSELEAKCLRADSTSHEYLGMDWDAQGQFSDPFAYIHIADIRVGAQAQQASEDTPVESYTELINLRSYVDVINKLRPSFVVITGELCTAQYGTPEYTTQIMAVRLVMGRVSGTIPVIYTPGVNENTQVAVNVYQQRFGADYYSFWCGGMRGFVLNTSLLEHPNDFPERAAEQALWLEAELELAQLNAQTIAMFGCIQWVIPGSKGEEINVDANTDESISEGVGAAPAMSLETQKKWLGLFGQCKVRSFFSGQYPTEKLLPSRIVTKVHVSPANRKLGMLADTTQTTPKTSGETTHTTSESSGAEGDTSGENSSTDVPPAAARWDPDDSSEEEKDVEGSDWIEERVRMEFITTPCISSTPPYGGIRIVKVFEDGVDHTFHTLENMPKSIDLENDSTGKRRKR